MTVVTGFTVGETFFVMTSASTEVLSVLSVLSYIHSKTRRDCVLSLSHDSFLCLTTKPTKQTERAWRLTQAALASVWASSPTSLGYTSNSTDGRPPLTPDPTFLRRR